MSFQFLLHNLARSYRRPGGIKQLAEDIGRADDYNVLKNKLNPNTETHHVYIEEIDDIVAALDTDEIAKYFCRQRGGIFVKQHDFDGVPDAALLELFLERGERLGEFDKKVRVALTDGRVTKKEFNEMMVLFDEVSAVREQIRLRITAIYDRGDHL